MWGVACGVRCEGVRGKCSSCAGRRGSLMGEEEQVRGKIAGSCRC